jgi:hypothetical protein
VGFLAVVALVVGVAVASWFAWVSLQSLLQARALYRVRALSSRPPEGLGPAGLYGEVRVEAAMERTDVGAPLWFRCTYQEMRGSGKNRGWKTVQDEVKMAHFDVEAGGRRFHVEEFPSEVQGASTRTVYDDEAFLGLFHSNGHRRRILRWLPVPRRVTVVGRVEAKRDGLVFVKDNKLGLLLSPHEPGRAAGIELGKGIAGLAAVTAAIIAGLWFYSENRR